MTMTNIFRMLREFESTANPNNFKKIFGEGSTHLWNIFSSRCDYNLVKFTRVLDSEKHALLMAYFDRPLGASAISLTKSESFMQINEFD